MRWTISVSSKTEQVPGPMLAQSPLRPGLPTAVPRRPRALSRLSRKAAGGAKPKLMRSMSSQTPLSGTLMPVAAMLRLGKMLREGKIAGGRPSPPVSSGAPVKISSPVKAEVSLFSKGLVGLARKGWKPAGRSRPPGPVTPSWPVLPISSRGTRNSRPVKPSGTGRGPVKPSSPLLPIPSRGTPNSGPLGPVLVGGGGADGQRGEEGGEEGEGDQTWHGVASGSRRARQHRDVMRAHARGPVRKVARSPGDARR